ncbi:uncharacterized protein LOC113315832 [Papaver somniferum]|uniref:uncharacterized protein LOC113315832 n=1 Tax=Papaver somniferum TaxID=3469 RepID=UPI000E6F57DB|nr:uncharacterized protein LOC113315832 [Papaver somniferum]
MTLFIKGRQILDCALLANECIDSRTKSGILGVICKIDFEKAFDPVSWDFVVEMLERMGFGILWMKWIQGCITDTPLSVLVNGSANAKFTTGKGMTQGDPLSPFLFLIVSEALNVFFQTGLHINFVKCSLFGVAGASYLSQMAMMLGCKSESFPSSYLGLPLGDFFLGSQKWESIIERCKNMLCSWKRSCLNKAGGLGIKSVKSMNRALLAKWWWRFNYEKTASWRTAIVSKHQSAQQDRETKNQIRETALECGREFILCWNPSSNVPS